MIALGFVLGGAALGMVAAGALDDRRLLSIAAALTLLVGLAILVAETS